MNTSIIQSLCELKQYNYTVLCNIVYSTIGCCVFFTYLNALNATNTIHLRQVVLLSWKLNPLQTSKYDNVHTITYSLFEIRNSVVRVPEFYII